MNKQFDTDDENIILGTVGAVIGAMIGFALWIFCGFFGIIPGIVGLALAILTVKGYMLLSGAFGRTGLIICLVIGLILVSVSEIAAVCLHIYFDWNIHDLSGIFGNIINYIRTERKILTMIGNTILGIFSFLIGCFGVYFRLWKDTADGPKKGLKIDTTDYFVLRNMPARKEIPIKGNGKWVAVIVVAAILYVIIFTVVMLKVNS